MDHPTSKDLTYVVYATLLVATVLAMTTEAAAQRSTPEVTPKTGATVFARGPDQRNAVIFRVINTSRAPMRISVSCERTGTVRECRVASDSISVPAGDTAKVRVLYTTGSSGHGSVSLRAVSTGRSDQGRYLVEVKTGTGASLVEPASTQLLPTFAGPHATEPANSGAAVFVTFYPFGGVFTNPALDVEIMWCSQGPQLNANSRSIRFNGLSAIGLFDYVDVGQSDCLSTAYSNGTITLIPGQNSLSARISDVQGTSGSGAATYTLSNPQPGPPIVDLSVNPGKNLARAACVTSTVAPAAAVQCGDLLAAYAMPAFRTLETDRTLTLLYNSGTAAPAAVVMADVSLPANTAVPDSLRVTLLVNGTEIASRQLSAAGLALGPRRIAMAFHPPTAGLGTGGYGVTLNVTSRYGASSHTGTATSDLIIVDRRDSRYGAGWGIAGVEQIFNARSNAKLIVDGDGSAAIYEPAGPNKWVAPAGAYRDTLYLGALNIPQVPAGTYYWRVGLDSTRIFYNTDGLQRFALTRLGRKTEYTYSNFQGGNAALAEVRIAPYNLDLRYRFHYDASARLDSITDPAGRILRADATSAGLVTLGQPGVTASTSLLYDPQLRLVTWTSPRNQTTTFTYHNVPWATGYLATSTVANIGSGAYTPVQLQGLLASTSQLNASVATDSAFVVIDGLRNEVQDIARFLVNGFNAPTTIIDPRGYSTRLTYDPGNPLLINWIRDALGAVQRMEYDSFGRLRFVRDESRPVGTAVTEYRYEDARVADKPTRIITPREGTLRDEVIFVYTATGLLDHATDPFGTTNFSYTAEGHIQQVSNAASEVTRFHYNPRGNADSVQIGGFRTFYGHDDYGNVDRVTPPVGSTVTTQHDQRNLPELITYFNDLYDGSQNVQVNTVMEYDADGNLELRRDGNGLERRWVSDAFGRPTEMRDELGAIEYRFYTADGLLNRITKRDHSMVATQYDAAGLPMQQESQPGANTGLINDVVTWIHDAVGRATRIENRSAVINRVYNLDGSLKQEASTFKWNGWALTYDYEYNLGGARSQMKITAQTPLTVIKTYNYARGPENFLSGVFFPDGSGATRQISFTPDVVGRRNTISFPGKTATFGFDNAGRLKTATGFAQFSYTFTYDAVGRRKTLSGTTPANWDYDQIGQATGVTRSGAQRSYGYDKAGNRRTEIGPVSFDYALWPNTNRMRSRCSREPTPQCIWYRYNANGDLMADSIDVNPGSDVVHRRWYDGSGRLTSLRLQGDEEFRYDGLGRLITRRDGQQLGIVTSYDGNNVAWKNGVFYVPGDATDDILAYVNGQATCHFIPVSGRLLYDDCPTDWPQIGEYSGLIKESFTFGQLSRQEENDASNSYFRNRWYDAKTGRFTQEDPIGFGGGSNLYAYAGNNPATYTDPFGLDCEPKPDCLRVQQILGVGGEGRPGTFIGAMLTGLTGAFHAARDATGTFIADHPRLFEAFVGLAQMRGSGGLGNPFKGRSPSQINEMFMQKGFEPRGPDPISGRGGYVNPRTGRSYHIDPANRYGEPAHVDVNRPRGYTGDLPKKKYPLEP